MSAAREHTPIRVAVSGADDLIGGAVLKLLFERDFAVAEAIALCDAPDGDTVAPLWGDEPLELVETHSADLSGVDLLFLCPPCAEPLAVLERAIESGVRVIDLIGVERDGLERVLMAPDLPVIGADYGQRSPDPQARVHACPDPLALILATVLVPIAAEVGLTALRAQFLLPASTLGEPGVRELAGQVENLFNQRDLPTGLYGRQLAFNLLAGPPAPTDHLARAAQDFADLLGEPAIPADFRAVWVPVFFGLSATVWLETGSAIDGERLRLLLRAAPGIILRDDGELDTPFPSPVEHALDSDAVHVSLLGADAAGTHGHVIWLVADDIRRGRALNGVRIAESLSFGTDYNRI